MKLILMVGFSSIFGTGQVDQKDDERQINSSKKIVSRFRGKLVKMIKDAGGKFDDYSIAPKLSIEFHSEAIYEQKYLKAKVREFDDVIKTNFLGNDMPKENMHYTCIACITIDSVMRIDKKNHPQVYLEECKYRVKKIQMSRFINTELKSDSDSELDSEEE